MLTQKSTVKAVEQRWHPKSRCACVFCARLLWRENLWEVFLAGPDCFMASPEVVAQMLEQCKPVQMAVSADGTQALSLRSGNVGWDAATQPTGLTFATSMLVQTFDSAAAGTVAAADVVRH